MTARSLSAGSEVRDSQGYGFAGHVLAGLPVIEAMIAGRRHMAVRFDGKSGQKIVLDDSHSQALLDMEPGAPVTLRVVFRTARHGAGGDPASGALIAKDAANNAPCWWLRVEDGAVRFHLQDSKHTVELLSRSTVSDNQWRQIFLIRQPAQGGLSLYLDGKLENVATDVVTGAVTNSTNVVVGNFNAAARAFDGDIACVQLYNAAVYPGDPRSKD